jgi:hypothetical protein
MGGLVTITVEVGFASNPSTAIGSTTWTDVSSYVRSISCRRGRNSELETFQPGSMQVVLANADRRFDPNYTSSPYSPNVLPMRRIRFRATYNAVTYDVWSGFVDDWPQQYDIGNTDATVTVNCTDGFKVMSLLKLAESVHWYTVMDLAPVAWWRLNEQSGTVATDSSGNGYDGTYGGGATFNTRAGLLIGTSDAAIGFDGINDIVTAPSPVSVFPVSIEAWIQTTTVASSIYLNVPVGGWEVYFEARTDGLIRANLQSNGSGSRIVWFTGSTSVVNDGLPHHVVAVYADTVSSPTLYIDGVAEAVTGSLTVNDDNNVLVTIGAKSGFGTPLYAAATIDEVAVYATSLAAGDVTTLYGGGTNPWEADGTGTRIGKYLDRVAWPAGDRTIATGISTLQLATLAGASALSLSQMVASSEQGQLFMGADGTVIFRDRHWRFENTSAITSQGTFGDAPGELDYSNIVTDGGEQFLTNHVRASREGGATTDVSDATSITKFYERIDEVSGLQNQSDLEVRDLANWRLGVHKNPIQRVTVLEVKPRTAPSTLFPQVLGRDIGHRLTEKRRPQNVGTALTYTTLVEGVSHNVTKDDWVTQFYLSSSDSQTGVQPLILDDATFGILDTNVLAY